MFGCRTANDCLDGDHDRRERQAKCHAKYYPYYAAEDFRDPGSFTSHAVVHILDGPFAGPSDRAKLLGSVDTRIDVPDVPTNGVAKLAQEFPLEPVNASALGASPAYGNFVVKRIEFRVSVWPRRLNRRRDDAVPAASSATTSPAASRANSCSGSNVVDDISGLAAATTSSTLTRAGLVHWA